MSGPAPTEPTSSQPNGEPVETVDGKSANQDPTKVGVCYWLHLGIAHVSESICTTSKSSRSSRYAINMSFICRALLVQARATRLEVWREFLKVREVTGHLV